MTVFLQAKVEGRSPGEETAGQILGVRVTLASGGSTAGLQKPGCTRGRDTSRRWDGPR